MAKSRVRVKKLRVNTKGSSRNKIATKRAAAKRYKVLGSGKVKVAHCGKQHNTGLKSRSRKNRLRKGRIIGKDKTLLVKRCLPNDL